MKPTQITPESTVFVLMSFEGPDHYSRAGGLATRVAELAETLARTGFDTHLVFVGSPREPGRETRLGGKLTLHRWCQWISKYYPEGVYEGEDEKLYDFNESLPWMIKDQIVAPAAAQEKVTVVMGEEWHTAEAICRLSDMLYYHGLRDKSILLWNANNVFSFHRINWSRLSYVTTITTVSHFMKHIMWSRGVDPIVVPNGVPTRLLRRVDERRARELRQIFPGEVVFFKLGRWDPDKRWLMAVEAMARLKATGVRPTLIMRGGKEPHEGEVLHVARASGLRVADVRPTGESIEDAINALAAARDAEVINLKFYLPEELVRLIYAAADGVLANSGFEPFGLVGLEAMAAGAVAYTGCTGEEYTVPFENAVVIETADPAEIARYAVRLLKHPAEASAIRAAGKVTAARFDWSRVISNLATKLEFLGQRSGVLSSERLQSPTTVPKTPADGRSGRGAPRPQKGAAPSPPEQALTTLTR